MSAPSPFTLSVASVVTALSVVQPCSGFLSPPSFLSFGFCKGVPVQEGIDFREFSGLWYTTEKVPNEYDPDVACTNTDYAYYGDHLRSSQRGLYEDRSKNKINTVLTFNNESVNVMWVNSPGFPLAPLKILSTDYSTYACMYTCLDFYGFKADFAYTLTRSPLPGLKALQACRDVFSDMVDLDLSTMKLVEQGKSCPYWSSLLNTTALLLEGESRVQDNSSSAAAAAAASSHRMTEPNSVSTLSPLSPVLCGVLALLLMLVARTS